MYKLLFVILAVTNYFNCYAATDKVIIWDSGYKCILNQPIPKQFSINNILAKIADTTKFNTFTYQSLNDEGQFVIDTGTNSINYIVYIGSEIADNQVLESSTNYLLKVQSDGVFYSVINSGWRYEMQPDSTLLQLANKDNHIYKTNTLLPNGDWYLYNVRNKKYYLLQETKIRNSKVDGYVKKYDEKGLIELQKYKEGILVDTLLRYNKGYLSSYEIRSSNGFELIKDVSYYPNTKTIFWTIDYILGYMFHFFEDGNIQSMVRIKENNKFGVYIEFDEKSNVVKKKNYPQ